MSRQYKLSDVEEIDGKLMLNLSVDDAVQSSETLMYYILNEKIRGKAYDPIEETKTTKEGQVVKVKKNRLPIVTIETGRTRDEADNEKLQKLLNDGFYLKGRDKHMVFLDNVLSGSQNKECRQLFVDEDYYQKLKEYVAIGVEPSQCTISKNLTRNALTTTDVYLVPVDMQKLGICIIPDCEVPVYETVNMIKPYKRTAAEDQQFAKLQAYIEEKQELDKKMSATRSMVNKEDCKVLPLANSGGNWSQFKTVRKWQAEGRIVKDTEWEKPFGRIEIDGKYHPVWKESQTEELPEDTLKEIPVTEWSTGLQLVTEENHACIENVFDGMGLVSKRLGEQFEKVLDVPYTVTGYQLRLPSIKGFFPCVDFHSYYKKHGIETIMDMWGQVHKIEDIDILTTESTFKAKLNVIGFKEDGSEKKAWLFDSIETYKERLVQYGYDAIGIANFAKPVEESYRRATYQLWLALNVNKFDMLAFANVQGDMIHKVLSMYRKEELDWEDIKYIESFLNLIEKENAETNLGKECADAIKAIHINKKMVFDRKVIKTIKDVVNKKIDDMCLGRMYIKGKYMYVTQDLLAFLHYAGAEDKANWQYNGFLGEKECYSGGKIQGETVLARNPITAYSEIAKVNFVDYEGEDAEFISHIDNIVQLPLGTEPDRLGGLDRDGDEVLVLDSSYNLKDTYIEFLQNFNFVSQKEDKPYSNRNMLEYLNEQVQQNFKTKFEGKEVVKLSDYVIPAYVQVNDQDKATATSKAWNKENVVSFILESEDRTGVITDIDSTIENVGLAEGDLTKYALPIAIMKDLQGKMIDASKSGLFDQVVIPEIIKLKYQKRPQFMYYKTGKENNQDKEHASGLDTLARHMTKFKEYVKKVMEENTNRKIKAQHFSNVYAYMQNLDLDGNKVQEVIEALDDVYKRFIDRNRNLAILKSKINKYSSDDKYKRERQIVDDKFKQLYEETKAEAENICDCPSLLATAAVRMTYINSKYNNQNDNYSFCWIVASEGILHNIKLNEDTEKVYITRAEVKDDTAFEWLGEYYKVVRKEGALELAFEKDMTIPEEYLRKADEVVEAIGDLTITIMNVPKGTAPDVAAEIDGQSYILFTHDKGWVGIKDDMSIKEKETLNHGVDLRKYIGHTIHIKEIIQAKGTQTVIKAIVDIKE